MLRIRTGFAAALALVGCALCSSPAYAQERIESSIRAWADINFFFGDLVYQSPNSDLTAVTPVLRGEIELSSWQIGLDLPFSLGFLDVTAPGTAIEMSGSGAQLSNPTLHLDYVKESSSLRAQVGFGLAIPTDDGAAGDIDELAANLAGIAGAYSRGMWNAWWYIPDTWTLFVPAGVESANSERELGIDGALAWFLPRGDNADNFGTFQLGVHAAMVSKPAVFGVRLQGVFLIDDAFVLGSDDKFQSSAELYAELRFPIVWVGAGLNACLDEPLSVFGDDPNVWSLRISGGASF
jgi:hypothetical protein